jgi:NAD(P)-dependent dehydrogenase (short-subunit alcohol dehydrogenase family)
MRTQQHPIGSGFGFHSTASEVLEGIDLGGKLVIVTGGYSGIGTETVRALTAAGATAIVPARRRAAAEQALEGIPGVELDDLDLGDQASVRAFAERFLASGRPLDILLNNAGIMAAPEARVGPGWESQFGTNHLGHFTLTNLLWPALAASGDARVVALSSRGHKRSAIRFDDLMFTRDPYDKWQAYGQAKTANSLFAVQLDALGQDAGVRAFSAHPGGIVTALVRHLSVEEQTALGITPDGPRPARFKTVEQGAATSTWAATSPRLAGMGGVYCEDCDIAELSVPGTPEAEVRGVDAHAVDPEAAARLWAVSAELTGVNAFA